MAKAGQPVDNQTAKLASYAADLMVVNAHERAVAGLTGRVVFEFFWESGQLVRFRHGQDNNFTEPPDDWSER